MWCFFCDVPAVYMSFCRGILFLAVLGVRVRFWLFYGLAACFTVVCPFMPLLARFVRGFVGFLLLSIILLLSGGFGRSCALLTVLRLGGFVLRNMSCLFFLRQFFFIVDVSFIYFFCR